MSERYKLPGVISKISVFYGHMASNIGDLAINAGEMAMLKKSFPGAAISMVFYGSETNKHIQKAIASCGVDLDYVFTFIPSARKALKYLSNPCAFLKHCGAQDADLIVLASGEHLFSYKDNGNIDGLFWRTLPILAAKSAGKGVVLFPSTLGPFEAEGSADLMRAVLGLTDGFAVRDACSKQYLESLCGFGEPPLLLDPAFFIDQQPTESMNVENAGDPLPDGHLAIVMRSEGWGIRLSGEQLKSFKSMRTENRYKDSAAFEFTKKLCDRHMKAANTDVVLYVQTMADEELAKSICAEYAQDDFANLIRVNRPGSIDEYLRSLSRSNFVVASRFHAIILSLVINKPVFGVYFATHGHKMPGLFEMLGIIDKCVGLTAENIDIGVDKVMENAPGGQKWLSPVQGSIGRLRQLTYGWLSSCRYENVNPEKLLRAQALLNEYSTEYYINQLVEESKKSVLNRLVEESKKSFSDRNKFENKSYKDACEQIKILTQREKSVRQSMAFQIGSVIVKDAKRPLHWPLLPIKMLRLYRKRVKKSSSSAKSQLDILKYLETGSANPVDSVDNRVCYVLHNSLPYASGGYATRAHGLSRGLIQNGYDVYALTRPGFPHDVMDIEHTGVYDREIDGVHYSYIRLPLRTGVSTARYMESIIDVFEKRFREMRPSIVLAASFYITALPAIIAARRLGIPVIYELRGLAEITRMSRDKSYKGSDDYKIRVKMETETAIAADHVFTLTSSMRDEFIHRGVDGGKITLLPNSCDEGRFTPKARDADLATRLGIGMSVTVIGYIGTIVDYEGLDDLVEACGLLRKKGLEFRLMIVGSEDATGTLVGPITSLLKSTAQNGGLGEWLIMPGRVPHNEVEAYYSLIDIAPFPRKPWPVCEMVSPMKPLEALAMEKAVVVSSVQALTDMISDEETGLVFEKGNTASLASVLHRLINDESLRRRLGKRGREFVGMERNWKTTAAKAASVMRGITMKSRELMDGVSRKLSQSPISKTEGGRHLTDYPAWWGLIDKEFADKCSCVFVGNWELSKEAGDLRKIYIDRFGEEAVNRRIPMSNWRRADICWQTVPKDLPLIDIGSGLGEFVNMFATNNPGIPISSVDTRDWDKWFDSTGRIERIYKSIFELGSSEARDVVTCFEVIEHLPPLRVVEAVDILRSLARKKLFVSVPFLEPPPMYKGHFTRFTEENLAELFPDAKFTVFAKGMNSRDKVHAWIMCEIDIN